MNVDGIRVENFQPIGEFELPEYELQKLSFPPILQILEYIERERFTEIIISTPGPMGLTGLLAAKLLNLQTSGIYHTDFPEYIRILTEDKLLESLAWTYMRWFYGQQETVFVNSEEYRRSWISRGIEPAKLQILPRGLDTELFHPDKRDLIFWRRFDGSEANVEHRTEADASLPTSTFLLLRPCVCSTSAAFRKKKTSMFSRSPTGSCKPKGCRYSCISSATGRIAPRWPNCCPDAIFTGYLAGEELATAYASADIFVFPSTTDTFGNVIIEAQASGLPVVVSDVGGPKELVADGVSGFVTKALDPQALAEAIRRLAADPRSARRNVPAARGKASSIGAGQRRSRNSGRRP